MPWLSRMVPSLCSAALVMFAAQALADDISPDLKRATDCMLGVLNTTPGVTHARLGVSYHGGWRHPFLEYRALEKARWATPTHFDLLQSRDRDNRPVFFGLLPGIHTPGTTLDFHITNLIIRKWQARCGVVVAAVTV